ncbi:MFS transporter [Paraburkholderia elongata]|uniref:MFS transporter n=1 Tax=Paraburkholderia elongata TaxID=2675747 RepID=A0A972SMJ8_9BURK|nr:MFS transporter [Paraburkholderia elongata]NPT61243.1 MFS transporter [Paraburkholderia elongata]
MNDRRRSIYNARLMYLGVALGAGGVAFYVPLMLSQVGLHFSGVWAASILFATNLGRMLGSHFASRHSIFTERPAAIVSTILLEGVALFSMAFMHLPWTFATVALAAGLGSGLSFPGLKNYLLKLKDLESARLFAGLSMAIRLGMLFGYLSGALITARHMTAVFTAILVMFIGYATFMRLAIADILANPPAEAQASPDAVPKAAAGPTAVVEARQPALRSLLLSNVVFWFLTIQPTVAMSLYVPRFVPGMSVSTTFWISSLTVLLLQMRVTRMAKSADRHFRFLLFGFGSLLASFGLMAMAGSEAWLVMSAAVLLALGQIFYVPSFDVIVSGYAKAHGIQTGPMMARQHFYQNIGVMCGSLVAGGLFDLGMRWRIPALNWCVLAVLSAGMLLLLTAATRRRTVPALG